MPTNLIGTGLDQVPMNGMLGDFAFQNKESIEFTGGTGALSHLDITAINATKNITANDVFVYDTSKDSDGGAWRKRTQHTSWYNEELNTATRGSRREFPSVAVIVGTATDLTIYDGDDASMPMWMVFTSGGDRYLRSVPASSIAMINASLVIGSTSQDIFFINFISERYKLYASSGYDNINGGSIVKRNTVGSIYVNGDSGLVDRVVNDVAMTVLPGAPVDSATGLPVPTIAVIGNGGVSVIKDNGTIAIWPSFYVWPHSSISIAGQYFASSWSDGGSAFGTVYHKFTDTPGTLETTGVAVIGGYPGNSATWHNPLGNVPSALLKNNMNTEVDTVTYINNSSLKNGLYKHYINYGNVPASLTAAITSKYNTGWMPGDTKGTWLSDTTQETVVSSELVTNGTFDSNTTTGWTNYNSTMSASSNQLTITRSGGSGLVAYQTINTVIGKTYHVAAKVNSTGSRGDLFVKTGSDPAAGTVVLNLQGTNGATVTLQQQFVATATQHVIQFAIDSNGTAIIVDDISLRLAEADRSVNQKGVQVFGTITKTPVATGADLVAYSGFGTANYLQQPYNSALDFGTGNFSVCGWVNVVSSSAVRLIYHRRPLASNINSIEIGLNTDGTLYFYTADGASTSISTALSGNPIPTGTWLHFCAVRNGPTLSLYVNGKLFTTASGDIKNVTNSAAITNIGLYIGNVYPWNGSLSLIRASATAPSDEQIRKMYEDERSLFQDNAKAVLYGSSDAVTALAYDDDTRLLHVGTSSGRSVFDGLRRIDNTTTAVARTISAANGLVAED